MFRSALSSAFATVVALCVTSVAMSADPAAPEPGESILWIRTKVVGLNEVLERLPKVITYGYYGDDQP